MSSKPLGSSKTLTNDYQPTMSEPDNTDVDMGGTEDRPPSEESVESATPYGDEDEEMSVIGLPEGDDLLGDGLLDDEEELNPSSNASALDDTQDAAHDSDQEPTQKTAQVEEHDQPIEDAATDVRETSAQPDPQDASPELDYEDINQDDDDVQDSVRENIEQPIEQADDVAAESMNPSPPVPGATNTREETEDRGDEIMSDARPESEEVANGRIEELFEPQDDADPMHDVQDDTDANAPPSLEDERIQTGSTFGSQQARVEDEQPEENSLFVPDLVRPPTAPTAPIAPTSMAPPPRSRRSAICKSDL
jgi:hypothetical protein